MYQILLESLLGSKLCWALWCVGEQKRQRSRLSSHCGWSHRPHIEAITMRRQWVWQERGKVRLEVPGWGEKGQVPVGWSEWTKVTRCYLSKDWQGEVSSMGWFGQENLRQRNEHRALEWEGLAQPRNNKSPWDAMSDGESGHWWGQGAMGWKWSESRPVKSNTLQPNGLYSPRNSPGQNNGVGSLPLLQGIFPTQGSNPGLPHCTWILYQLSHKGSSRIWNV